MSLSFVLADPAELKQIPSWVLPVSEFLWDCGLFFQMMEDGPLIPVSSFNAIHDFELEALRTSSLNFLVKTLSAKDPPEVIRPITDRERMRKSLMHLELLRHYRWCFWLQHDAFAGLLSALKSRLMNLIRICHESNELNEYALDLSLAFSRYAQSWRDIPGK